MIRRSPPKSGRMDKPAGGKMKDLKFIPSGKVYLTPGQKQARYIRMLERWVMVLGPACIILAAGFGIAVIS